MKLVVASHNPGKVWEIKQLLKPYGLDAISAGDLSLSEPDETETTFAGNAILKARAAADSSGLPALADDSGLEVACLGGAPGIYSARWAGPQKDFALAMEKVAKEVAQRHGWAAPGPSANFICCLALAFPHGKVRTFEGRVDGVLVWPSRGGNGFGYDPMFQPDGEIETFGEMEPERKHAMSHRARAFAEFEAEELAGLPRLDTVVGEADNEEGLVAAAANLSTREELAAFIGYLVSDLKAHPDRWENSDLPRFLEAMQAWMADRGPDEDAVKWRMIASTLLAARGYE